VRIIRGTPRGCASATASSCSTSSTTRITAATRPRRAWRTASGSPS